MALFQLHYLKLHIGSVQLYLSEEAIQIEYIHYY